VVSDQFNALSFHNRRNAAAWLSCQPVPCQVIITRVDPVLLLCYGSNALYFFLFVSYHPAVYVLHRSIQSIPAFATFLSVQNYYTLLKWLIDARSSSLAELTGLGYHTASNIAKYRPDCLVIASRSDKDHATENITAHCVTLIPCSYHSICQILAASATLSVSVL
jgi:hypothetical protein